MALENMTIMKRNINTAGDRATYAMEPSIHPPARPSKFGREAAYSPKEFPQENVLQHPPRSPPNKNWPLPSLPLGATDRPNGQPLSPSRINVLAPVHVRSATRSASFQSGDDLVLQQSPRSSAPWRPPSQTAMQPKPAPSEANPLVHTVPYGQSATIESSEGQHHSQKAVISSTGRGDSPRLAAQRNLPSRSHSRNLSGGSAGSGEKTTQGPALNWPGPSHHGSLHQGRDSRPGDTTSPDGPSPSRRSTSPPSSPLPPLPPPHSNENPSSLNQHLSLPKPKASSASLARPASAYSLSSEFGLNARARSPQPSMNLYDRAPSTGSWRSPDSRPLSYVDLLNVPYPQPPPAPASLDNALLRTAVGNNASLLSVKQTLDMYRANVKKTNDPTIQYEFAIFMVNTAQEMINSRPGTRDFSEAKRDGSPAIGSHIELLREARNILQRLADRSYPYAQYYLADGFTSGLFNKGVEDYDRAFPLFVAASKHGHAEAGYRAALCYEFGWGTRKDPQKAAQFYRHSASKNHPGAMTRLGKACMVGDLGLGSRYREGLKWLKRAAESADYQYNSAPYALGLLHETGFGDDIFQDQPYAAQLFTQSADLGHPEASYRLGDAYEHGKLECPRDPALSVHFYTGAAQRGHPLAQMALCAWYLVGAEPVLAKDEAEAFEWARKAAESGLPKAEYAVGYFTEMGIGCRRDPLEANVWYVKAADQGDERAKLRIAAIRDAASGNTPAVPATAANPEHKTNAAEMGTSAKEGLDKGRSKRWHIF